MVCFSNIIAFSKIFSSRVIIVNLFYNYEEHDKIHKLEQAKAFITY